MPKYDNETYGNNNKINKKKFQNRTNIGNYLNVVFYPILEYIKMYGSVAFLWKAQQSKFKSQRLALFCQNIQPIIISKIFLHVENQQPRLSNKCGSKGTLSFC